MMEGICVIKEWQTGENDLTQEGINGMPIFDNSN